jgi:hypothetical protein
MARKVLYTLGTLISLVHQKQTSIKELFQHIPGLHIRGFSSDYDKSIQYYRLYIPTTYVANKSLPLLLILPTSISARDKPFIESPFLSNHRNAVEICKYAEKYGFGVIFIAR